MIRVLRACPTMSLPAAGRSPVISPGYRPPTERPRVETGQGDQARQRARVQELCGRGQGVSAWDCEELRRDEDGERSDRPTLRESQALRSQPGTTRPRPRRHRLRDVNVGGIEQRALAYLYFVVRELSSTLANAVSAGVHETQQWQRVSADNWRMTSRLAATPAMVMVDHWDHVRSAPEHRELAEALREDQVAEALRSVRMVLVMKGSGVRIPASALPAFRSTTRFVRFVRGTKSDGLRGLGNKWATSRVARPPKSDPHDVRFIAHDVRPRGVRSGGGRPRRGARGHRHGLVGHPRQVRPAPVHPRVADPRAEAMAGLAFGPQFGNGATYSESRGGAGQEHGANGRARVPPEPEKRGSCHPRRRPR